MADDVCSVDSKLVTESMINNVMSICPDVDRKDVAKDLLITGSATRTINRILDGQVSEHTAYVFLLSCSSRKLHWSKVGSGGGITID